MANGPQRFGGSSASNNAKLLAHNESIAYDKGEAVVKDGKLYKANNDMPATAFAAGAGTNQWTLIGDYSDRAEKAYTSNPLNSVVATIDSQGRVATSSVKASELDYLAGTTSKVQDQLNSLSSNKMNASKASDFASAAQFKGGAVTLTTGSDTWTTLFTLDQIDVVCRRAANVGGSSCMGFSPKQSQGRHWHVWEMSNGVMYNTRTYTTGTSGRFLGAPNQDNMRSGRVMISSDDQVYTFDYTIYRNSSDNMEFRASGYVSF